MTDILQRFIDKVLVIKNEQPKYRQPGDASDGTCDCIGLVIGALKRIGINWYKYSGAIHGTNYAARKAVVGLESLKNVSQLSVGDVVFKANEKGSQAWGLDKYPRYLPGGKFYNGDLRDYYHIGVVTSVSPLNITHMTSPSVKVDSKLGYWAYRARLRHLVDAGAYADDKAQQTSTNTNASTATITSNITANTAVNTAVNTAEEKNTVSDTAPVVSNTVKYATVYSDNGKSVKMRKQPTTKCSIYDNVPFGARVVLVEQGAEWSKISYGYRVGWYMMSKFLKT